MEKLVSIIIPVYNVEKYLAECIESVIRQTYTNLEILLIDDGSLDNSGKICDEYAQKDERIKVIHKENGGVSSARNVGLDMAKGEYIAFVDSDDLVEKEYIAAMYENMQENNSDLVFCRYGKYYKGTIEYVQEKIPKSLIINLQDEKFIQFIYQFFILKNNIMGSACRILYKSSLAQKLRFDLEIKISEDLLFVLQTILLAMRVSSIGDYLYRYRQIKESTIHSYKKDFLRSQLCLYHETNKIFAILEDKQKEEVSQIYDAVLCYSVFSNELKYKQLDRKKKIQQVRESELYPYFTLKNGLRIRTAISKLKFLIVWFLVKTRLI